MRFLRQSLTGLFLLAVTLGLLVYAGSLVRDAVQARLSDEPRIPQATERVFAVNVVAATETTETPVITAFGEVQSARTLEIRAATGGALMDMAPGFQEGGQVKAGQLLARVDPEDAQAVLDRATMVARSEAAVFLSGEVGTGKTTFADIVHHASPRAHGALVTLSCATLTARDFESQIYGPQGALARAAEGTLYLDEVTDLSAEVQSRIARVIESCAADPGAAAPRFIGSTVHAPNAALQKGLIRPELYYRLHVAPLHLPPLRDREGDAALIAQVRLAAFSETEGRGFTGFTDTALAMISAYHWPGNLRELVNAIQTIVLMNQGPLVTPELLPPEVRAGLRTNRDTGAGRSDVDGMRVASPAHSDNTPDALVGKTLAEIERTVIEATIAAEDGSVPRAARVLDVSPSTLYRKREAWAKALDDEA